MFLEDWFPVTTLSKTTRNEQSFPRLPFRLFCTTVCCKYLTGPRRVQAGCSRTCAKCVFLRRMHSRSPWLLGTTWRCLPIAPNGRVDAKRRVLQYGKE